ncbi:hypothetical protein PsorP6_014449 [Peronosclerospora sorghi]|uniref:Uncharacterized protein n=1 Tax=Peronosclerospora sorghi TaxID=230839 RepID=A0ACC0VSF6_9STRA|nr:hypothetical protein PsorP6_014449 [Peronosclerospora sorghi]
MRMRARPIRHAPKFPTPFFPQRIDTTQANRTRLVRVSLQDVLDVRQGQAARVHLFGFATVERERKRRGHERFHGILERHEVNPRRGQLGLEQRPHYVPRGRRRPRSFGRRFVLRVGVRASVVPHRNFPVFLLETPQRLDVRLPLTTFRTAVFDETVSFELVLLSAAIFDVVVRAGTKFSS